jgi:RHS repeat-associated protein
VGLALPNGCSTGYSYDGAGRLLSVANTNSGGETISSFGYTLDAVGNRLGMRQELGGTTRRIGWEYDELYRLTKETRRRGHGNGMVAWQDFEYDGVGNRLMHFGHNITGDGTQTFEMYSYNANNQLEAVWSPGKALTQYCYDSAGNQTKATRGSLVAEYGFDYRNRMRSYDGPLGGLPPVSYGPGTKDFKALAETDWEECPYDEFAEAEDEKPEGKEKHDGEPPEHVHVAYTFYPHHWARHTKTVGTAPDTEVTKYLWDGDNTVAEYLTDDTVTDRNTSTFVTPFLDQNLAMTVPTGLANAGTYYYVQDGLGSVRNLLDAAEDVKNVYDYEAFGQGEHTCIVEAVRQPFGFTARRALGHSLVLDFRYRQNDPAAGRFVSRDPPAVPGGSRYLVPDELAVGKTWLEEMNPYAYVALNPVGHVDPYGLAKVSVTAVMPAERRLKHKGIRYPKASLWKARLFSIGEITPTNLRQLVEEVKSEVGTPIDRTGKCGNCLQLLYVISHSGSPGVFTVGGEALAFNTSRREVALPRHRSLLGELKELFCKGGKALFHECSAAAGDEGRRHLQILADALGVEVSAPTQTVDAIKWPWQDWRTARPTGD